MASIYLFGDYELRPKTRELLFAGRPCPIEPKPFELVCYLSAHRDRVVEKAELFRTVWGGEAYSEGVLSQCVWTARRALGDDGTTQQVIKTVRGKGYRFIAPIQIREAWQSPPTSGAEPDSSASARVNPLLGREAEVAELWKALQAARSGEARFCFVAGEPGIGKSHLVEELARRAERAGVRVLSARCFDGEGAPLYWPWIQIIRAHCDRMTPEEIVTALGPGAADIAEIVPGLGADLTRLAPPIPLAAPQARFRLFDSVCAFLRRAAKQSPLTIVIDDLHSADELSLNLLEFLCTCTEGVPLVVVATCRAVNARPEGPHALLNRLFAARNASVMQLGALSSDAVGVLMASMCGSAPDPRLVRAVYLATDGNPLFVRETMRLFLAERKDAEHLGDAMGSLPFPEHVAQVLTRRLERLPESSVQLLRVAAAIGREFDLDVLASASGRPYEEVLGDIEETTASGLTVELPTLLGRFRFGHSMMREAVYRTLKPSQRMAVHRDVGLAKERSGSGPEECAHHFAVAAPLGFAERAVRYCLVAAERSSALSAHEDAASHYERALEISRRTAVPVDALAELQLLFCAARYRSAATTAAGTELEQAARAAAVLGSRRRLAEVALGLAPAFLAVHTGVANSLVVSLLERALKGAGEFDPVVRARLLSELAMATHWSEPMEARAALCREALAIVEATGDRAAGTLVRSRTQAALWGPDDVDGRLNVAAEIVSCAESVHDLETALMHRFLRIAALVEKGEIRLADSEMSAFRSIATKVREPQSLWYARRFDAMRALMSGRFEDADRLAAGFVQGGQRLEPESALHSFGVQTAMVRWHQGRGAEILATLEPMVAGRRSSPVWTATLAYLHADNGSLHAARQYFDALANQDLRRLPKNGHFLMLASLLADTSVLLGDRASAGVLLELLMDHAALHVSVCAVAYRGTVARCLGGLAQLLSGPEAAIPYLERALESERRAGAVPWEALTLFDLGRALRAAGRAEDTLRARQVLADCRDIALRLGMDALATQVALEIT